MLNRGDRFGDGLEILADLDAGQGAPVFGAMYAAREVATGRTLWLTVIGDPLITTPTRASEVAAAAKQSGRGKAPGVLPLALVESADGRVGVAHEPPPGAIPYHLTPAFGGPEALDDVLRLAHAIGRLHDRGIVHGAVCLGTVARGPDGAVTWQHGIAGACESSAIAGVARERTDEQPFPPEFLAFGGRPTTATDVYAWAFTACQMLAGRADGAPAKEVVGGVGRLGPEHALVQVLKSCLNDNASARPRDARELCDRLDREGLQPGAAEAGGGRAGTMMMPGVPPPIPASGSAPPPAPPPRKAAAADLPSRPPPPPSDFGSEADFEDDDFEDFADLGSVAGAPAIRASEPTPPPLPPQPAAPPPAPMSPPQPAGPPPQPRPGAPMQRPGPQTQRPAQPAPQPAVGGDFLASLDAAVAREAGDAPSDSSPGTHGDVALEAGDGEYALDDAIAGLGAPPSTVGGRGAARTDAGRVGIPEPLSEDTKSEELLPAPGRAPVQHAGKRVDLPRTPGPHGLRPSGLLWLMVVVPLGLIAVSIADLGIAAGGFDVLAGLAPRPEPGGGTDGADTDGGSEDGGDAYALPDLDIAPIADLPGVRKRCPPGMVALSPEVCIDSGEFPGLGKPPLTDITFADAEAQCTEREARLCTIDEFRLACGGEEGHRFPYGDFYKPFCNVSDDLQTPRVRASGAMDRCRSPLRVYDSVGNVGEWVRGGYAVGGDVRTPGQTATCSARGKPPGGFKGEFVGFRCCMDRTR